MDFNTITEILIPIDGGVMNVDQLDINGQTLWKANKEPEWISLWSGDLALSFGPSATITTVTPYSSSGIPALPIRADKNPKGTFEFRLLLDFKSNHVSDKFYLKTPTTAGGELLGEFMPQIAYTDIPLIIDTRNTSRDVYNVTDLNFAGFVLNDDSINVPSTGSPETNCPLLIGSTTFQMSSSTPKFLRLQIKRAARTMDTWGVSFHIKGIEYRLV